MLPFKRAIATFEKNVFLQFHIYLRQFDCQILDLSFVSLTDLFSFWLLPIIYVDLVRCIKFDKTRRKFPDLHMTAS